MDVDNLIYDEPPPIGGINVLAVVAPALGKKLNS